MNFKVFEHRENVSRNAYQRNDFDDFKCFSAKVAPEWSRNDKFYKDSVIAFQRYSKYLFS